MYGNGNYARDMQSGSHHGGNVTLGEVCLRILLVFIFHIKLTVFY
jgi:hypothetical protein